MLRILCDVELIMSAGFVLVEVEEEDEAGKGGGGVMSGTYLKHPGGVRAERQLEFTLSRYVSRIGLQHVL